MESKILRRSVIAMVGGAITLLTGAPRGEAVTRNPVVGCLYSGRKEPNAIYDAAFLAGMHEYGWIEGKNIDIRYRYADEDYHRLGGLAGELVALHCAVILAAEPPASVAASKATKSIPIVGALLVDPINLGLVSSDARPGGNLSGVRATVPGLWGKLLEMAHELVPKATAVGVLANPANPGNSVALEEVEASGSTIGIKIVVANARAPDEIAPAIGILSAEKLPIIIVCNDAMFISERLQIMQRTRTSALPAIFGDRDFVDSGGLLSYSVSNTANFRRCAYFVDKILKGAMPYDLPVEFPNTLELVVNLKTAKALGITLPSAVLVRADSVIE